MDPSASTPTSQWCQKWDCATKEPEVEQNQKMGKADTRLVACALLDSQFSYQHGVEESVVLIYSIASFRASFPFAKASAIAEVVGLEYPHTVPADGVVGVEVEGHQAFWTCDNRPFILVLTTVPPHADSLVVSTKTKAGLVTEDDPLPF
ncbi:hypothetical protein NFI96_023544 [Prochilodus magdalenae]|nr:hypothetical protein NFI96_023544 [Prochilodus magdalenae]